jgi:hypothetical protein
MYAVILRASGRAFDPDTFLSRHALDADNVWHAGELGPGGRVRPESGFILTIATVPSPRELVSTLRDWVDLEETSLRALGEAGGQPVLEVKLGVESDPTMSASVTLEGADLTKLAALGVAFRVSAHANPTGG